MDMDDDVTIFLTKTDASIWGMAVCCYAFAHNKDFFP